jgi:hypothetical protein
MARETRREIARYLCEDDDLNEYTVIEYQWFGEFRSIADPPREAPGRLEYFLSDGRSVNWLSEDTFKIVQTDKLIRKVD